MANQEQLGILKQGVQVWNQWRREHPDILPDLSAAKLRSTNLTTANLSGVNLSGANLYEAKLGRANLSDAIVGWTSFGDIDLSVMRRDMRKLPSNPALE